MLSFLLYTLGMTKIRGKTEDLLNTLTLSPVTLFLTFSDLFEKFISIDWCNDILRHCG